MEDWLPMIAEANERILSNTGEQMHLHLAVAHFSIAVSLQA